MRRVAAKLGLGFAEIGGSRRSLFMRRSLGSLAVASAAEKSLYLCFVENSRCGDVDYVSYVVRPIKLKLISDDDDDGDVEKWLPDAFYQSPAVNKGWGLPTVNKGWGLSSGFGPGIIRPTGIRFGHITHFNCMYISTPMTTIPSKTFRFSSPKYNPVLWELNGKLYCIDTCPYLSNPDLHPFEVIMPEDLFWKRLDPPPFISGTNTFVHFHASFLEGSNKIIGWDRRKDGVYCFDTTMPEIGWTETFSSLSCTLPFLDYDKTPVFIRDHHPVLGTFHLMFMYDSLALLVTPFLMSHSYNSFQPKQPLHLPKLCYQYNDYSVYGGIQFDIALHYKPPISSDFEFVHLGDQKVCLVLNKYFPHDHAHRYRDSTHGHLSEKGILLLITFKYEIILTTINSIPTVQIQTRLLRTHRFRYQSKQVPKEGCPKIDSARMTGVFLL